MLKIIWHLPCRRRLSNRTPSLCCLPSLCCCLPEARPSHTSCRCLPNQAGIPQRDHRWKASPHHRVTASTRERWMIGFLRFPGPSKMSNIDSFVTQTSGGKRASRWATHHFVSVSSWKLWSRFCLENELSSEGYVFFLPIRVGILVQVDFRRKIKLVSSGAWYRLLSPMIFYT